MISLKKIGIAGFGKMGRDIFDQLHSEMPDTEFLIYVRHDAEAETEKINKNLAKALRRKKISEETFQKLSSSFLFTDDLDSFADCSLIIETVTEDIEIKHELFRKLDSIADSSCIFATNTSSLRIDDIFSVCSSERKTMGLHFFYPVKLSANIELNDCDDEETGRIIAQITGKEALSFRGQYCFYLNQYISFCICHAMILADRYNTGIAGSMDILSELFPIHSLFGMADSIGLGLLLSGDTAGNVSRIKSVLDAGREKMKKYIAAGCGTSTGMFLDFINEYEKDGSFSEADRDAFLLDMISAMINEAVISASENEGNIIEALYDTVGLSESFAALYKKYGYENISASLSNIREYTGSDAYTAADENVFVKFFGTHC